VWQTPINCDYENYGTCNNNPFGQGADCCDPESSCPGANGSGGPGTGGTGGSSGGGTPGNSGGGGTPSNCPDSEDECCGYEDNTCWCGDYEEDPETGDGWYATQYCCQGGLTQYESCPNMCNEDATTTWCD
jgi:hypothetical protein